MDNIIYLVAIVAAVWVIYDVVTNQKRMSGANKALWIICALFFSILTAIVYYLTKKR